MGIHIERRVAADLGQTGQGGGDDGNATGHAFQDRQAEPFIQARVDQGAGAGYQRGQALVADPAGERHVIAERFIEACAREYRGVAASACHQQPSRPTQRLRRPPRPQHQGQVFARLQRGQGDEVGPPVQAVGRARGADRRIAGGGEGRRDPVGRDRDLGLRQPKAFGQSRAGKRRYGDYPRPLGQLGPGHR